MKKVLLVVFIGWISFSSLAQQDIPNSWNNPPYIDYQSLAASLFGIYIEPYSVAEDAASHEAYKARIEQDRAVSFMNKVLNYYDAQKKYPETIPDGWHNVIAMNYINMCDERKVFVQKNQVIRYMAEDWMEFKIKNATPIHNGQSSVELMKEKEKEKGKKNKKYSLNFSVYFIDYLIDPQARATPPGIPGKASFWAGPDVEGGEIVVYLDGEFKGSLTAKTDDIIPSCGDKNTISFNMKSGFHDFKAMNKKNVWRGSILVNPGDCTLKILSKDNNTASEYE